MGFGSRALLAAVLGFAAAFVVACGSSGNGLLSSGQSSSIAAQLTAISNAVSAGHCGRATLASHRLTNLITNLPSGVNQTLVTNLGQGASTVQELSAKQCTATTSTPTVTVPTTTTPTSTTETQTETATTSSVATTTAPSTTTPPPTTATNGGGTGTAGTTTAGGGAPVGGATKTSGG
jgi:hypothetical protein